MNSITIGKRVRKKRIESKKSQSELAKMVGLHKNTIGLLERGDAPAIGLRSIIAIARALGVDPVELLS